MVNLGDIAKATGFSKATVSRVLSGDPSFTAKESTRHRVIQVANELGYALRTSRSSIPLTIAVLENFDPSNGPQDSYFSDVREALRERAAENMMSLTFFPDVRALVEAGQDYSGFVSLGPAPLTRDNLEALYEALPHGVFIDINPAPTLFHSVRPDLQQTVIEAIYALRESGRERIAFIGGDGHVMGSHVFGQDPRTVAFGEWARLLAMPVEGLVRASGPFSVDNGRRQVDELVESLGEDLPDAILVAADSLAVGVLQALSARAIRVPDQVAVVSIDNLEVCQYAELLRDKTFRAGRDGPHAAVRLDRGALHAQASRASVDSAGCAPEFRARYGRTRVLSAGRISRRGPIGSRRRRGGHSPRRRRFHLR